MVLISFTRCIKRSLVCHENINIIIVGAGDDFSNTFSDKKLIFSDAI